MALPKDFLWGGATAANQAEGGVLEGGRGLSNVDVMPTGPDRKLVAAGKQRMLEWDEKHYYPAKRGNRYVPSLQKGHQTVRRDGFQGLPDVLILVKNFPNGDDQEPNEKDCASTRRFLRNCGNMTSNL